ncbi:peptidylprolyl isomerase [Candidatus Pelagibacter sp.]|nr:peptidylprolyl isomerase [Candidatus Pelagibacter sp.]
MCKYKLRLLLNIVLLFLINEFSYAEFKIKYKVGEEIITNYDIQVEKNYLIFLRPNFKKLSEEEKLELSKNSLIREIIKKKQLDNIFKDLPNTDLLNDMKIKLMEYLKVNNEEELKIMLVRNNIEYNAILEKLKYEALWNEFIFKKFSGLVKIDEDKLKEELIVKISNTKKYEYNLSELLFDIENTETLEVKYEKIIKYININGFKNATYNFSISNSSSNGGEIGWVKETLLSEKLNKVLSNLEIGQITIPLKYPNGYLLIKINDKRELKEDINIENELKELIQYEKSRQLNQYSILFYKKLKQNTLINEY